MFFPNFFRHFICSNPENWALIIQSWAWVIQTLVFSGLGMCEQKFLFSPFHKQWSEFYQSRESLHCPSKITQNLDLICYQIPSLQVLAPLVSKRLVLLLDQSGWPMIFITTFPNRLIELKQAIIISTGWGIVSYCRRLGKGEQVNKH